MYDPISDDEFLEAEDALEPVAEPQAKTPRPVIGKDRSMLTPYLEKRKQINEEKNKQKINEDKINEEKNKQKHVRSNSSVF